MEGLKSELERFRLQAVATARRGKKGELIVRKHELEEAS